MIARPLKFTGDMSVTQPQGENILLVEFASLHDSLKTCQNLATQLLSSSLQFMVAKNTFFLINRWFVSTLPVLSELRFFSLP